MRHTFRLGRGWLPVLGATAALAVIPSVASAQEGGVVRYDPQTTNVPYLAWNGEEIRLERCIPVDENMDTAAAQAGVNRNGRDEIPLDPEIDVSFNVLDWSGQYPAGVKQAQIEPSTVNTFLTDQYDGNQVAVCVEGDAVSLYPGMAKIELDATAKLRGFLSQFGVSDGSAQEVLKQEFLAGWMTIKETNLKELGSGDFGAASDAAAGYLGDPSGDGNFIANARDGLLSVHVKGTIPFDSDWQQLGLPATATLPDDWVTLAKALASDTDFNDQTPYTKWDTSGDSRDTEGHVFNPDCKSDNYTAPADTPQGDDIQYAPEVDNVDNCAGGPEIIGLAKRNQVVIGDGSAGPFSTVFGDLSSDEAVGPYDPVNPSATLLPDGILSSQDAPMPAARVDVSIAPHTPGSTDGVGSLEAADKTVTYSRDFSGSSNAHNLYAPFYSEFIPATSRSDAASGVDAAYVTGNFPGFGDRGLYPFWYATPLAGDDGWATSCLRRSSNHNPQADVNPGDHYQTPSGTSSVSVFTDQNGEAEVSYNPGDEFYADNVGAIKNGNGACDLEHIGQIGTADISATAKYPYKPVNQPSVTSGSVHKTLNSLWDKSIGFEPKGDGAENSNARIVSVHANDIDGTPFVDEVVCFTSDAESMTWFNGTVTLQDGRTVSFRDTSYADDPKHGNNRVCVTTDEYGNAAVELQESRSMSVDVIADFTDEGILRRQDVPFGDGVPTSGGTPPPNGLPGANSGQNPGSVNVTTAPSTNSITAGTAAPTPTMVAKVDPSLAKLVAKKTNKPHIETLRLVRGRHGAKYLVVRVNSSSRSAKLSMRLISRAATTARRHSQSRTFTVRTNRTVKINVPKSTQRIKGAHLS